MSADNRRHPRLEVPIDGSWDGASGRRDVRITSLSLGGCFVDGLGRPAIGEQLAVELRFVGLPTITVLGEVVYLAHPQGFAVRFVNLPARENALIVRGLRSRGLADPYGTP